MASSLVEAAALGLLEGLTEFIPVSSTGHLLLAGHFLGFESAGKTFEVVIQLGAILAILVVYARRLIDVFAHVGSDPKARRFVLSVIVAFLPAAVLGALLHDVIKQILFESPRLISVMLILGGVVLILVDRMPVKHRHESAMAFPLGMSLKVGLFQALALVPGVSRSGATIVGALILGADRRAAAEFSFFLSIPTMLGAFTYDLYKNRDVLDAGAINEIVVGFIVAFLAALLVVRALLNFVSRYGFAIFGWWRIVVGAVSLAALAAGY